MGNRITSDTERRRRRLMRAYRTICRALRGGSSELELVTWLGRLMLANERRRLARKYRNRGAGKHAGKQFDVEALLKHHDN